jgi:hypothetical protein
MHPALEHECFFHPEPQRDPIQLGRELLGKSGLRHLRVLLIEPAADADSDWIEIRTDAGELLMSSHGPYEDRETALAVADCAVFAVNHLEALLRCTQALQDLLRSIADARATLSGEPTSLSETHALWHLVSYEDPIKEALAALAKAGEGKS